MSKMLFDGVICPQCKKEFFPPTPSTWAYRVNKRLVCSYSCMLVEQKQQSKKKKNGHKMRAVEMYSLQGELLHVYDDVNVAATLLNCSPRMIRDACRGVYHDYYGKIWRYKKENEGND